MKKVMLGILLGSVLNLYTMEPIGGHKDKGRLSTQSTSSSSSGSPGQVSAFDNVELHRQGSPALDTARLQQHGKIVITDEDIENVARLEELLKQASSDGKNKRKSAIYMPSQLPQLDLTHLGRDLSGGAIKRGAHADLEKGSNEDLENQVLEEAFDFFSHYMKDKSQKPDLDLTIIKKDLIKKFKKAHTTPPATPTVNADVKLRAKIEEKNHKLQKRRQGLLVLRKGSIVQATAREKRAQFPQSPALNRVREPKPFEILTTLMSEPEVQEGLQAVEQLVIKLLTQKNYETQSSLQRTRYGGATATILSAGVSALITYLSTRKSC